MLFYLVYSIFLSEQKQPTIIGMIWEVSKRCHKKTIWRTQKLSLFILQHFEKGTIITNKHKQGIRRTQKLSLFILQHIVKWTNITNKHKQNIRTQKLSLFILHHSVKWTTISDKQHIVNWPNKHNWNIRSTQKLSLYILQHIIEWT